MGQSPFEITVTTDSGRLHIISGDYRSMGHHCQIILTH